MHRRPLTSAAILLACAFVLAGCTGQDPAPTASLTVSTSPPSSASAPPTPSVSATRSLTPAEQDLESAGEAVRKYLRVLDEVASDPKVSLNVLATVARSQALEQWQTTLSEFRTKEWTQEGLSVVGDIVASTKDGTSFTVSACVDVSKLDVVDASGESVVADNRPAQQRFTYQVVKAPEGFFVTQDTLKGQSCAG